MRVLLLGFVLFGVVLLGGCGHSGGEKASPALLSPPQRASAANQIFLHQKSYDPWILTYQGSANDIPCYFSDGRAGVTFFEDDRPDYSYQAGQYSHQVLRQTSYVKAGTPVRAQVQTLNLRLGTYNSRSLFPARNWPALWNVSDITIGGDPPSQQVIHANLFYLLSSTFPGSAFSIAPMGLSSNVYGGHIFWDADVWMLPAFIVQHPESAKPIINYRFKFLAQAKRNAKAHGFAGAEFPWESADTGKEVAPAEFAQERHITADIGFAAWQYYLWTGSLGFLKTEGWPLLRETANYWVSRVTHGPDGCHINAVLSPDETAGLVNDDAWTNGVVAYNLTAAAHAAALCHQTANPKWLQIAGHLAQPFDKALRIPQENSRPFTPRFAAKQADTLLLIHPLGRSFDAKTQGRMLDFYSAHTISSGPAMTASIQAIVAARLGRGQQSLDDFHNSYRPFERGPWDAFSEKRSTNNVYFLTGMAGCVQSVLYGFAGLQVVERGQPGRGVRLAGDTVASLYADPHLPPGWTKLVVAGVHFRGRVLTVSVLPGNKVTVLPGNKVTVSP